MNKNETEYANKFNKLFTEKDLTESEFIIEILKLLKEHYENIDLFNNHKNHIKDRIQDYKAISFSRGGVSKEWWAKEYDNCIEAEKLFNELEGMHDEY